VSRRPGYIIGDHWLEVAFGRICAGDSEQAVLADYGWMQLTDAERQAIKVAERDYADNDMDAGCYHIAATLRWLLERTK